VKLALSTLCENPRKRTGLSTLFPEFVAHARHLFPEISWVVFAGADSDWPETDPGVEVCRIFPSNEHPFRRLWADHFGVAAAARRRGAAALFTVGFQPLRTAGLPIAMQVVAVEAPHRSGGPRSAYRQWAVNRGLRRAALVIANSEWTRSRLGPSEAPVVVSPEGLRKDLFTAYGPAGAPGYRGRYLLWVSNLYPYKRFELVLAAFARLPPQMKADFPLLVVGGSWGTGRRQAEAEVARLGIEGQVRFLGWVDDRALPSLYRGATAHVLSTAQETFGRSVLEAMACGCPNVVQDLPVLREVAGDCAVFVDFADQLAATRALELMCTDAGRRAQLRESGMERALQFSFERLARERVGAVLKQLGVPAP
jgi:alpha-1,3-rhamnosyl/mannosyltransferase